MSAPPITITIAGPRQAGAECPHCSSEIQIADRVAVCPICGRLHHSDCWNDRQGCGSYDCAPATRNLDAVSGAALRGAGEPDRAASPTPLRITLEELSQAPLPMGPRSYAQRTETDWRASRSAGGAATPSKASGWAIGSLATAIAGIPLFGIVTGFIAFILGVAALSHRRPGQRGSGLAIAGIIIGLADVLGWGVGLAYWLGPQARRVGAVNPRFVEAEVDLSKLSSAVARGMRANVLIEQKNGWKLGERAAGSGVILKIQDGKALIVTNRHVVDPDFSGDAAAGTSAPPLNSIPSIDVTLLGQPSEPGRIVWIAPDGIDLVLAEANCRTAEARAAFWKRGHYGQVGEPTFAIGNPYGFAWTHTQGSLSQYRTQRVGDRKIRVLQTQASLNPGNSGGGLYDEDGWLIGVNTLTTDKRVSEGIGFALSLETLWELDAPVPPRSSNSDDAPNQKGAE